MFGRMARSAAAGLPGIPHFANAQQISGRKDGRSKPDARF